MVMVESSSSYYIQAIVPLRSVNPLLMTAVLMKYDAETVIKYHNLHSTCNHLVSFEYCSPDLPTWFCTLSGVINTVAVRLPGRQVDTLELLPGESNKSV